MSDALHITLDRQGDTVVVQLAGEVDMGNAPELEQALATVVSDGVHSVVVDLGGLVFIDSSGLRVLAITARTLANGDPDARRLRVRAAQGPVRRVLEITGLEDVLGVEG